MFVDSHLHLDFDEFASDRSDVMARAAEIGIEAYLTIGVRVRDFDRVRAVAEKHANVFCTVGTLPHFSDEEKDVTAEEIIALTRHPKVVGIGEAGLDRVFGSADWTNQINVFSAHLTAAQETQLPLVIHSVREDETMATMLREATATKPFPFVIHAFSGGPVLATAALELGGYFGFGGLMSYEGNDHIREAATMVPKERILLETDSPSMCPAPFEDDRNEPANLLKIAELLARLRGETVAEVAAYTTDNFYRLFAKAARLPA
ncbi:MAG TPA: TatD family hydrolase [Devosia sp.]|nr:TatD family hydrolase [Devosia sp.]